VLKSKIFWQNVEMGIKEAVNTPEATVEHADLIFFSARRPPSDHLKE
jgi:hypothetical protein